MLATAVLVRAQRIRLQLEVLSVDPEPGALARLSDRASEEGRRRGEDAGRTAGLAELVDLPLGFVAAEGVAEGACDAFFEGRAEGAEGCA